MTNITKIILCIAIFLIMIAGVSAFEFDNVKGDLEKGDGISKYGKIEIRNSVLGLDWWQLSAVAELELKKNTDICGSSCSAEKEIKLYDRGSLIDDIKFWEVGGPSMTEVSIADYQFYIKTGEAKSIIDDYKWRCVDTGQFHSNGTKKESCSNVLTGSHEVISPTWEIYNLGDEVDSGTYTVKLEGKKDMRQTLDWVIESNGVWIDDWAVWNSSFEEGLVAAYTLEESTNSIIEQVFGLSNGTNRGGELQSSGINDFGVKFSGSGEDIGLVFNSLIPDGSDARTTCGWINITSNATAGATTSQNLLSYGDSSANGRWSLAVSTPSDSIDLVSVILQGDILTLDITDAPLNQWYMICGSYNGTEVKVYFNGTDETTSAAKTVTTATGNNLTIGSDVQADNAEFLNGTIDEVYIWNRTLSDIEINDLYNEGLGIFFPAFRVNLDVPEDNHDSIAAQVRFNCSATTVVGTTMVNISLWTNQSGTFQQEEVTTGLSGISNKTSWNHDLGGKGSYIWNCQACNSGGDCVLGSVNRTVNVSSLIVNSQTFNNPTAEGSFETFEVNLTFDIGSFTIESASLEYDGATFLGSTSSTGANRLYTRSITIPTVSVDTNRSFHWSVLINNGTDTSQLNSSSNNQTVLNINVDNCTSNANGIANFTMVDEEEQTLLSGEIEVAVNIFDIGRSILVTNFSESVNASGFSICSNIQITNSTEYSLDTIIKYSSEGYAIEYYNIVNLTLNNNTSPQNITLFDLNSNDSTPFRITFTGDNFLPVGGALVLLDRQYVSEGVFKTVELPLTDPNGQTILHMVRNDIIYNIRFLDASGTVLGNFQEITAFCEDPLLQNCQISLSSTSNISSTFNYDELTGLSFSSPPTFNSTTNIVRFDFVVPGGVVKTVAMNVTRNDVFGNRTVCQNSVTSTSGTLFCVVSSSISDTSLQSIITVNGLTALISTVEIDSTTLGSIGYVLWFVITLVLIFSFGDSKNAMLISLLISYAGAVLFGLSNGNLIGLGASGTWIVIITVLGIWRLNRDKIQ